MGRPPVINALDVVRMLNSGKSRRETARAMGDLCELVALRDQALAAIASDGVMVGGQAHPLLRQIVPLAGRIETGMARFLLTATGRPVPQAPTPVADPFAEFDRPTTQ